MDLFGKLIFAGALAGSLLAQVPATPAAAEREPGLYATMQTSMGNIVLKLYENESPVTVRNFVDLQLGRKGFLDPKTGQKVRRPFYNGIQFHRVIDGFMIQAGDPTATGGGNVGFTIKDEFAPALKFDKAGILAMANAGPNTGASQFFITLAPTPHLNGLHTIFGQVVAGMDVVTAIGKVPTRNEKPVKPVVIQNIKFERVGPAPANDVLAAPKPAAPAKKAGPAKRTAPAKKSAPAR